MPASRHRVPAPSAIDGLQCYFHNPRHLTTSSVTTPSDRAKPSSTVPLRLRLSARDVPEPDARSYACYAVVFAAEEIPVDELTHQNTSPPNPDRHVSPLHNHNLISPPHLSAVTVEEQASEHSASASDPDPQLDLEPEPQPQLETAAPPPNNSISRKTTTRRPRAHRQQPSVRKHRTLPASQHHPTLPFLKPRRTVSNMPTPAPHPAPQRKPSSSARSSKPNTAPAPPAILVPFICLLPTPSNIARAPSNALAHLVPQHPHPVSSPTGQPLQRSKWQRLGASEIARKDGRDVDFSTTFPITFSASTHRVLIKVVLFDCAGPHAMTHRLIGVSEFPIRTVFVADGKHTTFPLKFCPMSKSDRRWRSSMRDGKIVAVAEPAKMVPTRYRLDVECGTILRATTLSTAEVKRAFYTIHAIYNDASDCDDWMLLHRSETVQMIHTKRDGGTKDYNYFSSTRVQVKPGVIQMGEDGGEMTDVVTGGDGGGVMKAIRSAVGLRSKERFFSLPGVDVDVAKPHMRLKLSLYEDHGQTSGFELVADTLFTMDTLKKSEIGDSTALKMNANVVGRSELKFVSCDEDSKYFCLSLVMQSTH